MEQTWITSLTSNIHDRITYITLHIEHQEEEHIAGQQEEFKT